MTSDDFGRGRGWRATLDVCDRGHPLEGDNLILRPASGRPGRQYRVCRLCSQRRQREYYRRKKGAQNDKRSKRSS